MVSIRHYFSHFRCNLVCFFIYFLIIKGRAFIYWKSFGFIGIVDAPVVVVTVVVTDDENAMQSGKRVNDIRSETKLDL